MALRIPVAIDVGVQGVVDVEEVGLAVEVVAASLDCEVDDAARGVAELGRIAAGRNGELLKGVGPGRDFREERSVLPAPRLRSVDQDVSA